MRRLQDKEVLTTGEVAQICHVAPRTVSKWFDEGKLRGYRIPGSRDRRIPRRQLLAFMRAHGLPLDAIEGGILRVLVVGGHGAAAMAEAIAAHEGIEARPAANGFEAVRRDWPVEAGGRGHEPAAHTLVRADCLRWVAEAAGPYDLIWLDPPAFSNSKRMGRATFDVQRDHADLIRLTVRRLLAPGGVLLFATNLRNFRLARAELGSLAVKDLSRATLAFDCERDANRHHVFRIERRA